MGFTQAGGSLDNSSSRSQSQFGRGSYGKSSLGKASAAISKVLSSLGLDKRLREHTLVNLWPAIVGPTFSSRSRAMFIDTEKNLVVTVADASTGQELSLHKRELLKKLKSAGNAVGVAVEGVRFDLKQFYSQKLAESDTLALVPSRLPAPFPEDLEALELNQEELSQLGAIAAATEDAAARERVMRLAEMQIKTAKWRKEKGYPLCSRCRASADYLHTAEALCDLCYLDSLSDLNRF